MLRRLSHVGVNVSDLERSVQWYGSVLGLRLVARQTQANAYTRELLGVPDAVIEVAEFELPAAPGSPQSTLELQEYKIPAPEAGNLNRVRVGHSHVSFVVDDVRAEHRRLSAAGVEFISDPVLITEGMNTGGWICYFNDPDGSTLEIFQPAPVAAGAGAAHVDGGQA